MINNKLISSYSIDDFNHLESYINYLSELVSREKFDFFKISLQATKSIEISIHNKAIDKIELNTDNNIYLSVFKNNKKATITTSQTDKSGANFLINKAKNVISSIEPDEHYNIPNKDLMAYNYPNLDLYHTWDISKDKIIKNLYEAELMIKNKYKNIFVDSIDASSYESYTFHSNSHGFTGYFPSSSHYMSASFLINDNEKGSKERDYDYTLSRSPSLLDNLHDLSIKAAKKTIARAGSRTLSSRKIPVLFNDNVSTDIIGYFIKAIQGYNIYRRESFLCGCIGSKIFPTWVKIRQMPHLLMEMNSLPFDSEGVRTQDITIIKNGHLESYLMSSYSANRLNSITTGNSGGAQNIVVSNNTDKSLNDLIKDMSEGVVVTELIGHGFNLINGDFSRGACGFYVKDGEVQYPVNEITIAGNLLEVYKNIKFITKAHNTSSLIHVGSILVNEIALSGSCN